MTAVTVWLDRVLGRVTMYALMIICLVVLAVVSLVFTVIGRVCPWELAHYLLRGQLRRARVRFARNMTAVNLNRHKVWTRYYTPREFYRPFAREFDPVAHRALSLFLPPPYLIDFYERSPRFGRALGWLDDHLGQAPMLRAAGDHFLIVLRRR